MPLFRALAHPGDGALSGPGPGPRRRRRRRGTEGMESMDEDGRVLPLTRLCLLSIADNMKEVWVKDYADNYLDQYSFRYIMGPFSLLPGELVEDLTSLLCSRKQLSRAALHLLLVPQIRGLTLQSCPALATAALCFHIAARCQDLWSLDLSGAQQLPSQVLGETLCSLPALRSLSLAGTPCDSGVIRTVAQRCRLLRHLDVSRCHLLSPAALLPLGGKPSCSSPGSPSEASPRCTTSIPPTPLCSLLALDIGLEEEEGDATLVAASLLLSLPCLERVALEGLAEACRLIQRLESEQIECTDREGFPCLGELWREFRQRQGKDSWRKKEGAAEEEEDGAQWEEYDGESAEDANKDRESVSQLDDPCTILRLRDIKGLSCDSLDSLGRLCPNIRFISLHTDGCEDVRGRQQGSLLAAGLHAWSGQLQSLSVQHSGPLVDLLPALQVAGSSLCSLTLEGVQTAPHTPLLEILRACPKLRELLVCAEPPTTPQEEEDRLGRREDQDLPQLPDLCSLTLRFSYEHSQMKPVMSWLSLTRVLLCLLRGSPLLQRLSLVSLPCPVNSVLKDVLQVVDLDPHHSATATALPLARVRHIDLSRTDIKMTTLKSIMQRSKRLKCVDVSNCWNISQLEWQKLEKSSKVRVIWA